MCSGNFGHGIINKIHVWSLLPTIFSHVKSTGSRRSNIPYSIHGSWKGMFLLSNLIFIPQQFIPTTIESQFHYPVNLRIVGFSNAPHLFNIHHPCCHEKPGAPIAEPPWGPTDWWGQAIVSTGTYDADRVNWPQLGRVEGRKLWFIAAVVWGTPWELGWWCIDVFPIRKFAASVYLSVFFWLKELFFGKDILC